MIPISGVSTIFESPGALLSHIRGGIVGLVLFCTPVLCNAEHQIDVQRRSAEGDHFKALSTYEFLPKRGMNITTRVAAAESAWALGYVSQASRIFDQILREENLSLERRAKLLISRGAIEFQEGRYQESALFAQRAVESLQEGSPLRVRAQLLWGQALVRGKRYVSAEEILTRALRDSGADDRPEIALTIADVQLNLGKLNEAEKILKVIPADHEYAGKAVRLLSQIALQKDDTTRARFWLEKGRDNYSDAFLDSWADFSLASLALKQGDVDTATRIVEGARRRYPPSDRWLILIEARLEQEFWKESQQGKQR